MPKQSACSVSAPKVYEMSKLPKLGNLNDFQIPVYLLASSSADEARAAIIERAKDGERLTLTEVKRMIAEAKKVQAQVAKKFDAQGRARAPDFTRAEKVNKPLTTSLDTSQRANRRSDLLEPRCAQLRLATVEVAQQNPRARLSGDSHGPCRETTPREP